MRLIDADALKEKAVPLLFPTKMEPCGHIPIPVQAVVVAEIEQAPTIETEPVRHGRWGELDYDFNEDKYTRPCSNCGYKSMEYLKHYCPNCGCKMDGDSHAD